MQADVLLAGTGIPSTPPTSKPPDYPSGFTNFTSVFFEQFENWPAERTLFLGGVEGVDTTTTCGDGICTLLEVRRTSRS